MRLSRAGVINADFGAAFRVGVWVGGIGHHGDGEGDDGVAGEGGVAAGAEGGGVVGHGADVGGCEGDEEGEGEEGGAFHFFWGGEGGCGELGGVEWSGGFWVRGIVVGW